MGLDLLVFGDDADDEIDGFRIGMASDFDHFRQVVTKRLDKRFGRTRFPLLMRDEASSASWDASEVADLERELNMIAVGLARLPAQHQPGVWGQAATEESRPKPTSLLESFVTGDQELFVLAFLRMAQLAQSENGLLRTD